jgi:cytochrome b
MSTRPATIKVWDPLVRFGHWLLVLLFAAAYLSEDDLTSVHVWSGYAIATLVIVRTIWGFVGPPHARFADFVYRPRVVAAYAADLLRFRARRYLGHSPAGGAMVLALLFSLLATAGTGMATYAIREGKGPLSPWLAAGPKTSMITAADERGEKRSKPGRAVKNAHEFFANLTLALVLLHVGGVALASLAHRENLPRAMLSGVKRAA